MRLGGKVVAIADVGSSSVSKGETIEDTARCLECYVDAIVMRHPQVGSVARAAWKPGSASSLCAIRFSRPQ